jgi:hypothetical protein
MAKDFRACSECRFTNGSCRQFVIGHPNPVCMAGYTQLPSAMTDIDGLDLPIPLPRRSPENIGVR